jgi:hypothetical protein
VTNRVRSAKENVAELDACTASLRRNTRVSFPCFMLTGVSTVDENAWYVYNSLERRTAGTMYPAELAAMCRLSWLPVRNQSCRSENISLIVSDAYPGQTPHRRGSSIEHYQLSSGFVRPSGPVRSRDVFNNPVDRRHLRWSGSTQDVLERVLQAGSERAGQVAAPPWRPGQGTPQAREFSRRAKTRSENRAFSPRFGCARARAEHDEITDDFHELVGRRHGSSAHVGEARSTAGHFPAAPHSTSHGRHGARPRPRPVESSRGVAITDENDLKWSKNIIATS